MRRDILVSDESLKARVKRVRELLTSLGPAVSFRKLYGILNALEMQIEDGKYQRHAVARLCEALLAAAEGYSIPDSIQTDLEEAACGVISVVLDRR